MTGEVSIRIVGLVNGGRSPIDGQWLAEYDPTIPGTDPLGRPTLAHIVCTDDPALALRFPDVAAAHALWTAPSGLSVRYRPLTAFTIAVEPASERAEAEQ